MSIIIGISINFFAINTGSSPKYFQPLLFIFLKIKSIVPFEDLPYPLVKIPTLYPRDLKYLAKNITAGVFPVPPAIKFPTLITLHGRLYDLNIPIL